MYDVNVSSKTIKGYKQSEISYTLIEQRKLSEKLVIVLPGMGYNVHKPLLHFITTFFITDSYDVLHVNYNYLENEIYKSVSNEEKEMCIHEEVKRVIDEVLSCKKYNDFVVVAKSIGTYPISNELLTRKTFKNAKAIWLTPLLNRDILFEKMKVCNQDSLYIIGDNDPCFVSDRFEVLTRKSNNMCELINGADHSLEDKNIDKSIDNLKSVMRSITRFLS